MAFSLGGGLWVGNQLLLKTAQTGLELQILPALETLLGYLFMGTLFFSVLMGPVVLLWFLLNSEDEEGTTLTITLLVAYGISMFFIWRVFASSLGYLSYLGYLLALYPLMVLGGAYLLQVRLHDIRYLSNIRLILLACLITAGTLFPVYVSSFSVKAEQQLAETVNTIEAVKEGGNRALLKGLMESLTVDMGSLSRTDLDYFSNFTQARFSSELSQLIGKIPSRINADFAILDRSSNPIITYSNRPENANALVRDYLPSVKEFLQEVERNNFDEKAVLSLPDEMTAGDAAELAIAPVTDEDGTVIGWYAGAIRLQPSDRNEPFQQVSSDRVAAQLVDFAGEYRDGRLTEIYHSGSRQFELTLSPALIEQYLSGRGERYLRTDGVLSFIRRDDSGSIRISSLRLPAWNHLVFSFSKLFFSLLFGSLLIVALLRLFGFSRLRLLRHKERFQNRIIDSYLLASVLLLAFLAIVTEFYIDNQTETYIKQQVSERLYELTRLEIPSNDEPGKRLIRYASDVNIDASYFDGLKLSETTNRVVYRKSLLPDLLPFHAYHTIVEEQRPQFLHGMKFGEENLIVGFQPIYAANGDRAGILALPAFPNLPVYETLLLEATSYLTAIYILIFGLFIGVVTLISQSLTKPLQYVQTGLKRISGGNLDTTIPVTSQDEIGALANAYNLMVYRLRDLQNELAEAEREAAWNEMARQVAHEIKNPLTPMKLKLQHLSRLATEVSKNGETLRPAVAKTAEALIEQVESLNRIAGQFSSFARPISESFEELDLNKVLAELDELYKHDHRITLKLDLQDRALMIEGAREELKRVFINLVTNAIEALPDRGGSVIIRSAQHSGQAIVEVVDNGEGIPEELQKKLFVPYFSTKSSGTGLGLAICRKIILAHNGTIELASVKGTGTTFTVTLPLAS